MDNSLGTLHAYVHTELSGARAQHSDLLMMKSRSSVCPAKGIQSGDDFGKPVFSSNVASRSTNYREITELQSNDADEKEVLRNLVERLREGSPMKDYSLAIGKKKPVATMQIEELTEEFKRIFKRNCLIVLDDLSTTTEWDLIEPMFWQTTNQIIVTTREENIASHCSAKYGTVHNLQFLNTKDAVCLFSKKGIQSGDDLVKPMISSGVAPSTSTNYRAMAPCEITELQSNDADEKEVVKKSPSCIGTSVDVLDESQLIGREKDISDIIELMLNHGRKQYQVISVWGMGGVGKTSLVESVYQSPKLSKNFAKRAFITIMRPFDLAQVLRNLVERLREGSPMKDYLLAIGKKKPVVNMKIEELTEEFKRILEMKNCLIVLDYLSTTTEWDLIEPMFRKDENQIIVTTREENIANHCSRKYGTVHNLQVLETKDALCLFSMKVFGDATNLLEQKNPALIKEAKKILAIMVICGFLENRPKTPEEWRKLTNENNISAELEINPKLGMIRKGYDDHIICRRRLVGRWAAEGYSSEKHGKSANEMADSYFMELKNRSMILPSPQQSVHNRKIIDSCEVHDLIHEIAISNSVEENLVFRLEDGCSMNTSGAIRHLAISGNWKGDQTEFEGIVDMSQIRSLSVFGLCRPFFISEKMRFLRMLDLEGTEGVGCHHLDHIGKLLLLKYLSVRGCFGIHLLPNSVGNLRQLQTLYIRDTYIMALPKTISKLRKLRYIHAGVKSDIAASESTSLRNRCLMLFHAWQRLCSSSCAPCLVNFYGLSGRDACTLACSVKFPAIMKDHTSGAMMPRGIGKLKELHTLREVFVGTGNIVLQDIKMLSGLRKLGIAGINNRNNGPAFRSAISNLHRLESLTVRSAGKLGLCGSSPPENLQSLKLYGKMETLPEWIRKLPHLVKLILGGTELSEAAIEFLENLPKASNRPARNCARKAGSRRRIARQRVEEPLDERRVEGAADPKHVEVGLVRPPRRVTHPCSALLLSAALRAAAGGVLNKDARAHLLAGTPSRHVAPPDGAATKGCATFWVEGEGGEAPRRAAVPVARLDHPRMLELLREAREAYGFEHEGVVAVPCGVDPFMRAVEASAGHRPRAWPPPRHHHHFRLPHVHIARCFRPSHVVA
ncbi:Pi-b protein [Panicum miliaceum]|uniref:Pi-b protein n=1 Tax=Panicum miliaceum TaxID=4540 RepID=A0A3L6Q3Q3_PANMI|nr:Pi-b protein [Panicum miliaceum]